MNLNIHYHMLFINGVYFDRPDGTPRFRWVRESPSREKGIGERPLDFLYFCD